MKNKLIVVGCTIYLIAAMCWENNQKNVSGLSDLALENIEALASGEQLSEVRCYGFGSVDCVGVWVEMKIII